MRIIGGKFRGRTLVPFKGRDIRPTSDRVKESLFNILAPEISGANVLDLFCGTGSVGLEAISRGADAYLVTSLPEYAERKEFAASILVPACERLFSPAVSVIPLQLLAYETALACGNDPDKPRNLAKSVTVE